MRNVCIVMMTMLMMSTAFNLQPVVMDLLLTGLSTRMSFYVIDKAPVPLPERRKVVQSIVCCSAISTGYIIDETRRAIKNESVTSEQSATSEQSVTSEKKVIRTTRKELLGSFF